MDLLFSIILAFFNARRARQSGLNGTQWGIFTFLLFLLFEIVSGSFVLMYFYGGELTPTAVSSYLLSHPVHTVFMWFCGFGGYLLMRYRIDKIAARNRNNDTAGED